MFAFLAYRPFIDPLNVQDVWFLLLLPLSFGVAMTYKAIRVETAGEYWRKVIIMTAQLVLGIVVAGLVLYGIVQFALPRIVPMS